MVRLTPPAEVLKICMNNFSDAYKPIKRLCLLKETTMKHPFPPKGRKDFDVAIICALQLEADAVESIFDKFWDEDGDRYGKAAGDKNAYRTGVIGNHNVVLAYMPGMGKVHAASVAISCYSSFRGIRLALIVGICGGVPQGTEDGIFLGDIVISDEFLMYDIGKMYPGGFQRKETVTRSAVDSEVPAFLRKLKSPKGRHSLLERANYHLIGLQSQSEEYHCPGRELDRLFEPEYHHKHGGTSKCKKCRKGELCKKAQESTCEALECDPKKLIPRSRKNPSGLNIHFGRIASGDMVMKSGVDRDRIAAEEDVIAFEMEGAGVCGSMPFIVIKGVCDYADSHKDKTWQKYTAGAAAASMRSLLEQWAAVDHAEQKRILIKDLLNGEPESPINTPSEIQSTRGDEGYHSQNSCDSSDGEITQGKPGSYSRILSSQLTVTVFARIGSCFKSSLACFRQYRKCLPGYDVLKSTLKTQRVIFTDNVKGLSSDAPGSVNDHLGSSRKVCLQAALEIERKLEYIQGLTKHLPVATKAREQSKSAAETLKVH
jgi:nucleoside phosphorylase